MAKAGLLSVTRAVLGAGFGIYCSTKFAVEGSRNGSTPTVEAKTMIADYAETSGKVRAFAKQVSLKQPGDPQKLATAVVELSRAAEAPLRLPLGTDAVGAIEAKHAFVADELTKWRSLSVSTDFPR